MWSSFPAEAPESQLTAEQPLTGECWNPPKRDTPQPRTKKKLQQDGGRGTIHLKSNLIPTRDAWRVQTNLSSTRTEGKEQWPSQDTEPGLPLSVCLRVSCGGMGQQWPAPGTGLQQQQCGRHGVWHKSSWRRPPLIPL